MRAPRNSQQKKLDAAMRANAALYLLETMAEMLGQIPRIDSKSKARVEKWREQFITERNRMLPLCDAADDLLHNARLSGAGTASA